MHVNITRKGAGRSKKEYEGDKFFDSEKIRAIGYFSPAGRESGGDRREEISGEGGSCFTGNHIWRPGESVTE